MSISNFKLNYNCKHRGSIIYVSSSANLCGEWRIDTDQEPIVVGRSHTASTKIYCYSQL